MFNLLTEPFIRTRMTSGEVLSLSLPQIFEAFLQDEVAGFVALRPHQQASWHMLLAQLGAIATHRSGKNLLTTQDWADALLHLAPMEAWDLIGNNDDRPAFLQVPVSGTYRTRVTAADALDVLITARNHSVKAGKALEAHADSWLFALVCLQTMEGFLGAGNYGVSRMNGGFASRPFLGLAPKGRIGAHVLRDIRVILQSRAKVTELTGLKEDGIDLVWLLPWDGSNSLPFEDLAPGYIEICRRVRLGHGPEGIFALTETSSAARVNAASRSGITGDHWCPVNLKDVKAFTADNRGFDASVLTDLLFAKNGVRKFDLPPSMTFLTEDEGMQVVARVLVRGQGKTEGFHERQVPFRKTTVLALRSGGIDRLAGHARDHLVEIDEICSAMRYAVLAFCAAGDAEAMKKPSAPLLKQVDTHVAPLRRAFQREADALFFERIQDRLEDPETAIAQMREMVLRSREMVATTLDVLPALSSRKLKCMAAGDRTMRRAFRYGKGRLANHFDQIFPKESEKNLETPVLETL